MAKDTTEKGLEKAHRKQVIEALAQYQKRGSITENSDEIAGILADESDRAAVIITGSLIEDILADRIISQFKNGKDYRKDLLRTGGPLGSFVAKMQVALAMGLLTEEHVEALELLRLMRNACAHSRLDINLRTPELKTMLLLFFEKDNWEEIESIESADGMRLLFTVLHGALISIVLGHSAGQVQRRVSEIMQDVREAIDEALAQQRTSTDTPTTQSDPDDHPAHKD